MSLKKDMFKVLLFIVMGLSILSLPNEVLAQETVCDYYIEGKVFDLETKLPLPFANVIIKETGVGTVTDIDGAFRIENLCEKEFDILISFVGYKTVLHHHDTYHKVPEIFLAPDDVLLEGVVVEGEFHNEHNKTTVISEISGAEIDNAKAGSIGELASNISGVTMLSTGQNIVKPMIHGMHSSRILIINNGIRHEFQNWGAEHAPEIDVNSVDHVEVIKGAATVKYGPEAMGGVLLIDKDPIKLHTKIKGEWEGTFRTNGKAGETHFKLAKGFDNTSFSIGGGVAASGDLNAPDYFLTNTSKLEKNANATFLYHTKSIQFEGFISRFEQDLGILRGTVTENFDDLKRAMESLVPLYTTAFDYITENPRQYVVHDLAKLKSTYSLNEHFFSATYSFQNNHRQEYDVRRGTNNDLPSINLALKSHIFDLEWYHPEIKGFEGNMGLQWTYQDNNNIPGTNTYGFIPNFNNYKLGYYWIESWESEKNTFEVGWRFDLQNSSVRGRNPDGSAYTHHLDFGNFSGTMGWIHKISNNLNLSTNVGTSWRPPNISELYIFGKHQSSVEYGLLRFNFDENNRVVASTLIDNDNLKIEPELGYNFLQSLEFKKNKFQWVLSSYYNYIENYIFAKPAGITNTVRGPFPYFIYVRTDANFMGLDADFEYNSKSGIDQKLSFNLLYASQLNGTPLIEIPPATINYRVSFSIPNSFLDVFKMSVEPTYTFRSLNRPDVIQIDEILLAEINQVNIFESKDQVFDLKEAPKGYFLLASSVQLSYKKFNFQLKCNNLFNTSYRIYTDRLRYFSDQTGRNFIFSLKVDI